MSDFLVFFLTKVSRKYMAGKRDGWVEIVCGVRKLLTCVYFFVATRSTQHGKQSLKTSSTRSGNYTCLTHKNRSRCPSRVMVPPVQRGKLKGLDWFQSYNPVIFTHWSKFPILMETVKSIQVPLRPRNWLRDCIMYGPKIRVMKQTFFLPYLQVS